MDEFSNFLIISGVRQVPDNEDRYPSPRIVILGNILFSHSIKIKLNALIEQILICTNIKLHVCVMFSPSVPILRLLHATDGKLRLILHRGL